MKDLEFRAHFVIHTAVGRGMVLEEMLSIQCLDFFFHRRVKKETRLSVSLLSVEAVAISDCIKSYFFQSPPHILGDSLLFYIRTNEL